MTDHWVFLCFPGSPSSIALAWASWPRRWGKGTSQALYMNEHSWLRHSRTLMFVWHHLPVYLPIYSVQNHFKFKPLHFFISKCTVNCTKDSLLWYSLIMTLTFRCQFIDSGILETKRNWRKAHSTGNSNRTELAEAHSLTVVW